MKRSTKPILSLLLLIVAAATLSCRLAVVGWRFALIQSLPMAVVVPRWNATLLKHAAIDFEEAQFKKEVEQLMEANFWNQGRHRSFLSSGRHKQLDIWLRLSRGLPVQIRSPQFYRLWLAFRKNLHDWWRNKRFEPDIMSQLVTLVRTPIDQQTNTLVGPMRRYSSCAVVGNSGILLKSEYGNLIDSHEMVIRLNNARIDGFEHNVGSKTGISFINSNILRQCARKVGCFCSPYGATVPIVMYICQAVHFMDYTLCNSSQTAPLVVTDLRFDVLCARIVKYYSMKRFVEVMKKPLEEWTSAHDGSLFHYSSGMQAVMLSLGICEKVSMFGFGKSDAAKHHYHTNQKAELRLHDYEAEYQLYHDLVDRPQVIPFISDKFKFPPVVMYR
ncbi:Beta-galactoside alpha-2,3-sialyltransferase [Bertholletia excelsa]